MSKTRAEAWTDNLSKDEATGIANGAIREGHVEKRYPGFEVGNWQG